ncbi:DUF3823 domain-containing protein [Proteiniphilum sp.]|uniref:DUF3823 domain-containing protein n=1 Tax=Proteiniphilum sp. TaxID=1926877 RepID=UPI00332FE64E
MKNIEKLLILLCLGCIIASCAKDNYDAPNSFLSGKIVFEGTPLNLRGTGGAVGLQLYQHGYDYFNPINVFVGQDGSFSATLFDGDYLLVKRDGNGPWVNSRDSLKISVKGNTAVDLDVTPFFMISDDNISMNGSKINASFTINQIVNTAKISNVLLLLNNTQFVDDINNIFRKEYSDLSVGPVDIEADISNNTGVTNAKALFGRVCVWTEGADQGIYSEIVHLK